MENNFCIVCIGTINVNGGDLNLRNKGTTEQTSESRKFGNSVIAERFRSNAEKESRKGAALGDSEVPEFRDSFFESDKSMTATSVKIPDCLNTPEVWATWRVCINEKWVDGNLRPLISRTKISVVAHRIYEVHNLEYIWKFFELLWGYNNMRNDYQTALSEMQFDSFREKVENLIR